MIKYSKASSRKEYVKTLLAAIVVMLLVGIGAMALAYLPCAECALP